LTALTVQTEGAAKPSFLSYYLEHLHQETNGTPEELFHIKVAAATAFVAGAETVS